MLATCLPLQTSGSMISLSERLLGFNNHTLRGESDALNIRMRNRNIESVLRCRHYTSRLYRIFFHITICRVSNNMISSLRSPRTSIVSPRYLEASLRLTQGHMASHKSALRISTTESTNIPSRAESHGKKNTHTRTNRARLTIPISKR
jgi:hypothetical protein